jgi:hypothetical protein
VSVLDTTIPGEVVTILDEFGANVTLQARWTTGEYSVATGKVTTTSPVTGTVKASPLFSFRPDEVDGALVQFGDAQAVISATLPTGVEEDELTGGRLIKSGTTWQILGFEKIESGASVAAYILQLRR